jgi:hypothetical protein
MPLRVLTPARSEELVALSQVKQWLGLTDDFSDAVLQSLIATASSAIVGAGGLGFPLARQTYEYKTKGNGKREMYLSPLPVDPESVEITINGGEVTDWSVEDAEWGLLFRSSGWTCSSDGSPNVVVTFQAGYLLPNDIAAWGASSARTAGSWTRSSSPAVLRFECTTAGTTGATEPTWPTEAGETVVDGSATWTARTAWELPKEAESNAFAVVLSERGRNAATSGLKRVELEDYTVEYAASSGQTESILPPNVRSWISAFGAGRGIVA